MADIPYTRVQTLPFNYSPKVKNGLCPAVDMRKMIHFCDNVFAKYFSFQYAVQARL